MLAVKRGWIVQFIRYIIQNSKIRMLLEIDSMLLLEIHYFPQLKIDQTSFNDILPKQYRHNQFTLLQRVKVIKLILSSDNF